MRKIFKWKFFSHDAAQGRPLVIQPRDGLLLGKLQPKACPCRCRTWMYGRPTGRTQVREAVWEFNVIKKY